MNRKPIRYLIPNANWHTALSDTIKKCGDGDVIIARTESMLEIGIRAHRRMCPGKTIRWEILTESAFGVENE